MEVMVTVLMVLAANDRSVGDCGWPGQSRRENKGCDVSQVIRSDCYQGQQNLRLRRVRFFGK